MNDLMSEGLDAAGLTVIGGFAPGPDDSVPAGPSDRPAAYLALIGNAGPAMFQRFASERNPKTDLLDDWCEARLDPLAARLGVRAVYPWQKPYLPFVTWARKAGAGQASPLGMNIHPEYGLWHGFRGAFIYELLPDAIHDASAQPHPCDSCREKPCLNACPVDAFVNGRDIVFDSVGCVSFLQSADGNSCLKQGCRARLACPIGPNYAYTQAQIEFHLSAFFQAHTAV